jgi:hypothetical protein
MVTKITRIKTIEISRTWAPLKKVALYKAFILKLAWNSQLSNFQPILKYVVPYDENNNSRQNITILFWKYLVDIRSEAWLNLFGEYINRKLFAVWLMLRRQYLPYCTISCSDF